MSQYTTEQSAVRSCMMKMSSHKLGTKKKREITTVYCTYIYLKPTFFSLIFQAPWKEYLMEWKHNVT